MTAGPYRTPAERFVEPACEHGDFVWRTSVHWYCRQCGQEFYSTSRVDKRVADEKAAKEKAARQNSRDAIGCLALLVGISLVCCSVALLR